MRERDGEDAEDREQDLEEQREVVAGREPVVRGAALPVDPADRRRSPSANAKPVTATIATAPPRRLLRQHEVDHDREQQEAGERHDRRDLAEVGERLRPRVVEVRPRGQRAIIARALPGRATSSGCVSTFG